MLCSGNLAKVDVLKGLEMFASLNVPTMAAVENMSYFKNPSTGEKHKIFGEQVTADDLSLFSESDLVRVPLSERVSSANDSGDPLSLKSFLSLTEGDNSEDYSEESEEAKAYTALAGILTRKLFERDSLKHSLEYGQDMEPSSSAAGILFDGRPLKVENLSLKFDADRGIILRIFEAESATETLIDPNLLFRANPKTGELMRKKPPTTKQLRIRSVDRKGSYGYAITWGNGATVIYTMQVIVGLADRQDKSVNEK